MTRPSTPSRLLYAFVAILTGVLVGVMTDHIRLPGMLENSGPGNKPAGWEGLPGWEGVLAPAVVQAQSSAGNLESPNPGGKLSGLGFISGWKCNAQDITVRIDGDGHIPVEAIGIPRDDTRVVCGTTLNGFLTQFNWAFLADGPHTIVAYDGGVEFARNTFTVTTTGEEFVEGAEGECSIEDFPAPGETTWFEWNEATQHLEMVPGPGSVDPGRVLFSEDFESYTVGSLPEDYVIVYNGLGTAEQRIETAGGNQHLRTAGRSGWGLSIRKDFDFDLPPVVSVSVRMRVDNDLDRYSFTLPNGAKYAVFASFAVKNADESRASFGIAKFESDQKIVAVCTGGIRGPEVQLGVWTEFRMEVDFAAGRQAIYAGGEKFCELATDLVSVGGSWGESAGIVYASGNSGSGASVTRFDDIVIRGTEESDANADLVVQSPSVSGDTLTPGQSFTFSATVRNRGDATAGSTTLRYYRSSDRIISSGDTSVGRDSVGSLAAGASSAESISLTAPSTTGVYYYGACVGSPSGESPHTNNCSGGVRVSVAQVAQPYDLAIPTGNFEVDGSRVGLLTVSPGQRIDLDVTVTRACHQLACPPGRLSCLVSVYCPGQPKRREGAQWRDGMRYARISGNGFRTCCPAGRATSGARRGITGCLWKRSYTAIVRGFPGAICRAGSGIFA